MSSLLRLSACLMLLLAGHAFSAQAALVRQAGATLAVPTEPPPAPVALASAFPAVNLVFSAPVALRTPPGETNRLFIVEQSGRIQVITNLAKPNLTLFLDIHTKVQFGGEQGLLSMAFHPGYATNGYFYVFYTPAGFDRLSRFQVSPTDPNKASATEQILINQADEASNHNGGDLHFGPDGYLYVSLGDEGGGNDQYANSQKIDKDFFAGMLRLDVDRRPGSLTPNAHAAVVAGTYAIPSDNPFIGATSFNGVALPAPAKVHTEFWAVGLRNPWRYSFDSLTDELWVGDVGQDNWEEIDILTKGGNYGWNYREGKQARPGSSTPPAGFKRIDPIYDYSHPNGNSRSITGGLVYRGQNISQLYGAYIFADYVSGEISALRRDPAGKVTVAKLTTESEIAAFGVDPRNGDVLLCNVNTSGLRRLTLRTGGGGVPIPPLLSGTGAFTDLAALTPAAGVVPYGLNLPFWSDHAIKKRWMSVPDPQQKITLASIGAFSFPTGTVFIKHFELELTNGVPESRIRLETRFLVRGTNGIHGFTYRWGGSGNEASLVGEEGRDETFVIQDGGIQRTQVWHYPSRGECLACHNQASGFVLGFDAAQLNRSMNYGEGDVHQLKALADAGYFSGPLPDVHSLPRTAVPSDESASLEWRVKSLLEVNCAMCHRPGGLGVAKFDARLETTMGLAGLIQGDLNNNLGDAANRVISPGSLDHSVLLSRVSKRGAGQMPPLASTVVDEEAEALLSRWITNALPSWQSLDQWRQSHFGSLISPDSQPGADADGDGFSNEAEYRLQTDPTNAAAHWSFSARLTPEGVWLALDPRANVGVVVEYSSSIGAAAVWKPLDVGGNELSFPSAGQGGMLLDSLPVDGARFYRARFVWP